MQPDVKSVRRSGGLRLIAVYLLVAALVVLSRPTPRSVNLGLAFVAVGEAIRIWAAGHLQKTLELVTSGPYRYTRNPLYLGRLLIFVGLCIMARMPYLANLAVLALGCLVFFAYYLPRKERVEPKRLEDMHGEPFREYFRAVPGIFPALRPYAKRAGSWKWANFGKNEEILMVVSLSVFFAVLAYRIGLLG